MPIVRHGFAVRKSPLRQITDQLSRGMPEQSRIASACSPRRERSVHTLSWCPNPKRKSPPVRQVCATNGSCNRAYQKPGKAW